MDHPKMTASQDRIQVQIYRRQAWAQAGRKCAYCERRLELHEVTGDHAIARASGGKTVRSNIKAACLECNIAKGKLSDVVFMTMVARPAENDPIAVHLVCFRRRLELRLQKMERRIAVFCGASA
jgi:hypothetical protein